MRPALVVAPLALAAVVVTLGGCPQAQPFFSSDIGVQAVPIQPGSAAGTFALKTVNATIVHLPAGLGDKQGGGVNYRLVTRTYDEKTDTYKQTSQLCGGYNYSVEGVNTDCPTSTYRAVLPSPSETVTIDASGKYTATGHLQLWGLHDLPDPYKTVLPTTKDEANQAPWTDRIFDMDHDTNPGITLFVTGAISGKVYAFQRKTVDLDGVSLSPDHFVGIAHNKNEALTIGADNPLVDRQSEGSATPNPDPKQSYFEEARIPDGSKCDDIFDASTGKVTAEDNGTLSTSRPY